MKFRFRYVKVVFNGFSSFEYSYLDDSKLAKPGDYVLVPVGENNDKKFAYVTSVGDYTLKNVPYPIKKTKRIFRLATEEEINLIEPLWEI